MEKKNTILLTVIAVATLLVAVVGATFAYYSLSTSGNFATTQINATTQKIDLVSLDESSLALDLTVTPADMAVGNENTSYFAIKAGDQNDGESVGGKYSSTAKNYEIAKATLETEQTVNYECTGTAKITVDGTMLNELNTGDAILLITTGDNATITETGVNNLDLSTLKDGEHSSIFNYKYTFTGAGAASLKVDMKITNTEEDQTTLAGKTLNVTIKPENPTCTIQ